jgi:parvulin-like peptidyl-prolyl isomerase
MAGEPLTVNGKTISEEEVAQEVARLRDAYQRQSGQPADGVDEGRLRAVCVDNLVARALLRQAAEPLEVSPEELDKAFKRARRTVPKSVPDAALRADVTGDVKVRKLLGGIYGHVPELTDEQIGEYYSQHRRVFEIPEQVHARHMVRHLDGRHDRTAAYLEMLNVQEQLKKGASFEELAKEHSDCPDHGGDLGYFSRGQMVGEFENVVFALGKGAISEVFETPFGYHIAKVEDVKPGSTATLDEVREVIRNQLRESRRTEAVKRYVEELRKKAEIRP